MSYVFKKGSFYVRENGELKDINVLAGNTDDILGGEGNVGDVLTKTEDGYEWQEAAASVDRDEVEEIVQEYISSLPPSSGGGGTAELTDEESVQTAVEWGLVNPIVFNDTYILTLNDEVISL